LPREKRGGRGEKKVKHRWGKEGLATSKAEKKHEKKEHRRKRGFPKRVDTRGGGKEKSPGSGRRPATEKKGTRSRKQSVVCWGESSRRIIRKRERRERRKGPRTKRGRKRVTSGLAAAKGGSRLFRKKTLSPSKRGQPVGRCLVVQNRTDGGGRDQPPGWVFRPVLRQHERCDIGQRNTKSHLRRRPNSTLSQVSSFLKAYDTERAATKKTMGLRSPNTKKGLTVSPPGKKGCREGGCVSTNKTERGRRGVGELDAETCSQRVADKKTGTDKVVWTA